MKIAFFLSDYPVFSETFITNELLWLQKSAVEGKVWYEIKRNEEKQPTAKKINFPTQLVPKKILNKKTLLSLVKAHWYWLSHFPLRYFQTLVFLPIKTRWLDVRALAKAPLIAQQVKEFNPSIIYNHDADNAYYFSLLCSRLTKTPLTVIFHTYHLFYQTKHLGTKIKESDSLIFQSKYSKKYAQNKAKIFQPSSKFHVVSSAGVDTHFFQKNKNFSFDPQKINIVTVCRLEESKGIHLLIQAIALLKKEKIQVSCKIIGYGSQEKKLITLRDSLGLSSEVRFLGKIAHSKNLIAHLSSSEIFILPSVMSHTGDRDMQPNVIKESMSMELLTLTSNLGGIKEVIQDNENGFLLKSNSPKYIAQKIKEVWSLSKKQKSTIMKRARETVKNKYESQKINKQLLSLFAQYEK